MTAHERERLAAWLDGELGPGERAEVEAHLGACSECAALLAEMEGVDEVVRAMPLEAPPGYFDGLPGHIRSRIESDTGMAVTVAPAPVRGRVPAWTWAAAAALLLAVITPLTLHRLDRPQPSSPETAAPMRQDVRPRTGTLTEERDEAVPVEPEDERESRAKEEQGPGSLPEKGDDSPRPAFAAAPAPEPAGGDAPRSREALAAGAEGSPPPGGPVAVDAARSEAETPLLLDKAPEEAMGTPTHRSPQAKENRAGRDALASVTAAPAKESASAPRVQGRREGSAAAERKVVPEDSQAFARLAGVPPSGAAAWRERREAWRSFLDTYPESRHADEARVRLIEAGLEAWRAGADAADLTRAREDARGYLARDDARQKDRVRRALAEIEGG
jgi:hypothetical protein